MAAGSGGRFQCHFGLLILFRPLPEGVLAIAWLVGFFAIVIGVLQLMLAFRVRKD